jgi:signal transduction histidine kinase
MFTYGVGAAASAIMFLRFTEVASISWFNAVFARVLVGLFATAGIYSALLVAVTPKPSDRKKSRDPTLWKAYRNMALLLSVLLVIVMVIVLLPSAHPSTLERILGLIARSFPLIFLVVNTYYLERFTFFDVFVKRGTFSLLVLGILTVYFYYVTRAIVASSIEGLTPWLLAVTLLPIALSLPWLYRRLETWLDRVWLGRRYTPEDAVQYFLSGVQSSTTEDELVQHAEQRLADIFQADTAITLGNEASPSPDFEPAVGIPIRVDGAGAGVIHMDARPGGTPYFSKDVDLLTSLAGVFSNMLENVRLQRKKRDQEKRERELEIHASRSELKALRAQINPHFLFNALNAIAGLVHRNPDRAEETVEQLSEVFRYTLRSSEKEWARLQDEIEFVRSYLDVEQARFGNRLRTSIEVEDAVGNVEIPAMMIQTVVENAVKHGVAMIRGTGSVSVRARQHRDYLVIEVEDNGPGFADKPMETVSGRQNTGHGLKSIRERLHGYFGNEARLKVERDDSRGLTIITIELPRHHATNSNRR